MTEIAILRVRGQFHLTQDLHHTLALLGLPIKNNCVVKEETPVLKGMLTKVKDYITWGPVLPETKKLLEQRGSLKETLPLAPPRGGYGRKGTKIPFTKGGALGDRGEKINDLLKRMVSKV